MRSSYALYEKHLTKSKDRLTNLRMRNENNVLTEENAKSKDIYIDKLTMAVVEGEWIGYIDKLIKYGIDVNYNICGLSATWLCVLYDHSDYFQIYMDTLIKIRSNINTPFIGCYPIHLAIMYNQPYVNKFIDGGADINKPYHGYICDIGVEHNFDIDKDNMAKLQEDVLLNMTNERIMNTNIDHANCLWLALYHNNKQSIILELIKRGQDVNHVYLGVTPYWIAKRFKRNKKILDALVEHGADTDITKCEPEYEAIRKSHMLY